MSKMGSSGNCPVCGHDLICAGCVSLKEAATNLLKWHDEELPKWTGFISMNLIRKGMTTIEGAKDCEAEVRALRKALNEKEIEK